MQSSAADGTNIIDSTRDNMQQFYFAPQTFDATIPHPMTAMSNAVGGSHTLHLEELNDTAMIGYSNTWNITVN